MYGIRRRGREEGEEEEVKEGELSFSRGPTSRPDPVVDAVVNENDDDDGQRDLDDGFSAARRVACTAA